MKVSSASAVIPTLRYGYYSMVMRFLGIPLLVSALGCQAHNPPPSQRGQVPTALLQSQALGDSPELTGVSGVAVRTDAEIWLAPERTGKLVRVSRNDPQWRTVKPFPITNLPPVSPDGTELPDVESIAFLSKELVLLGTEAHVPRHEDPIYIARIREQDVVIEDKLLFDYRAFAIQATTNHGIEGLCIADGAVVAASEMVETEAGQRRALVGVIPLETRRFYPHRVVLESKTGKLSAITCRAENDRVVIYGIERHFGVIRLVRFSLPKAGPSEVAPTVLVHDLVTDFKGQSYNVEGLSWLSKNTLVSVTDNYYRKKTGPTLAFLIHLTNTQPAKLGKF